MGAQNSKQKELEGTDEGEEWESLPPNIPENAFEFTYTEPLGGQGEAGLQAKTEINNTDEALWEFFVPSDNSCSVGNHYQIERKNSVTGDYTHHFMTMMGWQTEERMHVVIGHYTNDPASGAKAVLHPVKSFVAGMASLGEIKIQEVTITKISEGDTQMLCKTPEDDDESGVIEEILKGNVVRVMNPHYPNSIEERQAAVDILLTRCGETCYSLDRYNCQHLITHILLGQPLSDQAGNNIMKASCLNHLLANIPNFSFRKVAKWIITSFMHLPVILSKCTGPAHFFKLLLGEIDDVWGNFLGMAMKTGSGSISAAAAFARAGVGGAITAAIEVVYLICQSAMDIYSLCKSGAIKAEQFVDNFLKRFSGSLGCITGTIVGGVIGLFIPLPFGLGITLGSMMGGFAGRWLANASQQALTEKTITGEELRQKMITGAKKLEKK